MAQKIKFLGKEVQKRDKRGRFARATGLSPVIALILILIMSASVAYYNYTFVFADVTEYVAVTAEVKLDCTISTHMYTEECIKRFTDDIAEARALAQEARHNLDDAIAADTKANELLDTALDNYNTIYGN